MSKFENETAAQQYETAKRLVEAAGLRGLTELFRSTVLDPSEEEVPVDEAAWDLSRSFELMQIAEAGPEREPVEMPAKEEPTKVDMLVTEMANMKKLIEANNTQVESALSAAEEAKNKAIAESGRIKTLMNKKVKELEDKLAIAEANAETAKSEAERARGDADKAISDTHTVTNRMDGVMERASDAASDQRKDQVTRLEKFTDEDTDIILWYEPFDAQSARFKWDDDREVLEQFNLVKHSEARLVMKEKSLKDWKSKELRAAIIGRLRPDYNIDRLEAELGQIVCDPMDDPSKIMKKVQTVITKASSPMVPAGSRKMLQRQWFMRHIEKHQPMHTYVNNHATDMTDPEAALRAAKKYLLDHGNANVWLFKEMEKRYGPGKTEAGVAPLPSAPTQPSALSVQGAAAAPSSVPPGLMGYQTPVPEIPGLTKEQATIAAHFLKKGEEIGQEDLRLRLNNMEGVIRDLRTAGLPPNQKRQAQGRGKPPSQSGSDKPDHPKGQSQASGKSWKDKKFKKTMAKVSQMFAKLGESDEDEADEGDANEGEADA